MIERLLIIATMGAVLTHGAAQAAGRLAFCIDKASASAARDQNVAEAVARQANQPLSVAIFDSSEADDGVSVKEFKTLLGTRCAFVMGYPMEVGQPDTPPGLRATKPYAQTGFVLVVPTGSAAKSLADFAEGTSVAVTFETAPQLYFLTHTNVKPSVQTTEENTLKALVSGQVKAAILWQPTIEAWLRAHDVRFTLYPIKEPHARFDVVALYAPQNDGQAQGFDAAVAKLTAGNAPVRKESGTSFDPAMVRRVGFDKDAAPAIYTAAQEESGARKFATYCAACHGAQLQGLQGPALKGPNFASVKSAFAVNDIFAIVSQNMPASAPGSLKPDDYVDIMAFLLNQNGYPAGSTALTFDAANTSTVPLVYRGQ